MPDQSSPEILIPSEVIPPHSEHAVYFVRPQRRRYRLNVGLLAVTFFTTLVVGAQLQWNFQHGLPPFPLDEDFFPVVAVLRGHYLLLGLPFSLTLMLILLAHEMGHYLYCLKYRVAATLPFFIPFPTLIGTLGAFIRIRSPLRSRQVLFDIGIAGPIAGFLVAVPVLVFSLGSSHVVPAGAAPEHIALGYPLIFRVVQELLVATGHGRQIAGVPLGQLTLSPIAIAAWVGMFATSLNLLPGGQLDGGHIIFALSPRAHKTVSRLTILALIPLALFYWTGWIVWAVLLRISGMRHPAVEDWPPISAGRRWLALFALIMLILTFCYLPLAPSDGPRSLLGYFPGILGTLRHWLVPH